MGLLQYRTSSIHRAVSLGRTLDSPMSGWTDLVAATIGAFALVAIIYVFIVALGTFV